jgi:OOP family OmpA-OmpF porin
VAVAVAVALVAGGVSAAQAEGVYVGGNVGVPDFKGSINGIGGQGDGAGVKLYGGYEITPNLAVEAGVFSLGRRSDSSGTLNTRGFYAEGVGRYPLAPQWSLLGSAGLAEGRFTSALGDDSSPALKVGAGVQYDLTRQTALRVQYDLYHFANAYGAKPNIGEVSVGVKFGF